MIVLQPADATTPFATLWLSPNRALSRKGLHRLMWVLAAMALTTSGLGAWQGNVFAPLFAVLESVAVALALGVAWGGGERAERIRVDEESVRVQPIPGRRCVQLPSYWVRVQLEPGARGQRLVLSSHGRMLEVGAFLAEHERVAVSKKLKALLVDMQG